MKPARSNIEILAEILNNGNKIPYSGPQKSTESNFISEKPLKEQETIKTDREIMIREDNDFIDEYELEALQHRVLSQNIKQGIKRITSSKRFETIEKTTDKQNIKVFKDFKNFVRPSTSQINFHESKLISKPKKRGEKDPGPRFLSEYDKISVKDVKTYKDLQEDKHLMPLEINYKYKVVDFYGEKEKNIPSTAGETQKREVAKENKKKAPRTSQGKRRKLGKSSSVVYPAGFHNIEIMRSSNA